MFKVGSKVKSLIDCQCAAGSITKGAIYTVVHKFEQKNTWGLDSCNRSGHLISLGYSCGIHINEIKSARKYWEKESG